MVPKLITGLILSMLFIAAAWFFRAPLTEVVIEDIPSPLSSSDPSPRYSHKNASLDDITLPVVTKIDGTIIRIEGAARGYWFFEASFPVEIVDAFDNQLTSVSPATAQSEWMTTEFVPYVAEINLTTPYSGPAKIILHKDNPSGEPERDASLMYEINL